MPFHGTKTAYQITSKHFVAQPKGHMQNDKEINISQRESEN